MVSRVCKHDEPAGMLTSDCSKGLYNLMKMGFVHRDISTENCFIIEEHEGVLLNE